MIFVILLVLAIPLMGLSILGAVLHDYHTYHKKPGINLFGGE